MLLVTGFGPFGEFDENPSAILAGRLGLPHRVLEVSFSAVEEFLLDPELNRYQGFLLLGVNSKGTKLCLETTARNFVGPTPDATGVVMGPGPISPGGPPQRGSNLWRGEEILGSERWDMTVDAGGYLCNYLLYRALEVWPDKAVGFAHVPPADEVDLDLQTDALRDLVSLLTQSRQLLHA